MSMEEFFELYQKASADVKEIIELLLKGSQ